VGKKDYSNKILLKEEQLWYIFRHGETLHNIKRKYQGRCDSLLTIKGVEQAKAFGVLLKNNGKNINNYNFFSSPMKRTLHTSQIICEICNIDYDKVIKCNDINEINIGILTDIYFEFVKNNFNEYMWNIKDIWNFTYPNGESYNEVYERIKYFIEKEIRTKSDGIIVTHGVCIAFIKNILSNKPKKMLSKDSLNISQESYFTYETNREDFEQNFVNDRIKEKECNLSI
jgi:probable phosphoglycerate mutase